MTDTEPPQPLRGTSASSSDGTDAPAAHNTDHSQGAQRAAVPDPFRVELLQIEQRVDGLRNRMRTAVDLLGVLLLGLSGAALLVVSVLAIVGFINDDTGIGLLFSGLAVVCLPLVAFAGWRAFQPLWQLSQELGTLRAYEQKLRAKIGPVLPDLPDRAGKAKKQAGLVERLPPGRSPTGWRQPTPRKGMNQVLSTRQVGWRVVVIVAVVMVLFAAGVLTGILTAR